MRFPIYEIDLERVPPFHYGVSSRRDPPERERGRACFPPMKVPIYRVVLRKDGTLRVPRTKIDQPVAAHEVAYALIGDRPFENLVAIFLNNQSEITGATIVATAGALAESPATVRGIFTGALVHNAAGIILAHNHPSGSSEPSGADIAVTRRMREAGSILGVPIIDHLIITRDPSRWRSIVCP